MGKKTAVDVREAMFSILAKLEETTVLANEDHLVCKLSGNPDIPSSRVAGEEKKVAAGRETRALTENGYSIRALENLVYSTLTPYFDTTHRYATNRIVSLVEAVRMLLRTPNGFNKRIETLMAIAVRNIAIVYPPICEELSDMVKQICTMLQKHAKKQDKEGGVDDSSPKKKKKKGNRHNFEYLGCENAIAALIRMHMVVLAAPKSNVIPNIHLDIIDRYRALYDELGLKFSGPNTNDPKSKNVAAASRNGDDEDKEGETTAASSTPWTSDDMWNHVLDEFRCALDTYVTQCRPAFSAEEAKFDFDDKAFKNVVVWLKIVLTYSGNNIGSADISNADRTSKVIGAIQMKLNGLWTSYNKARGKLIMEEVEENEDDSADVDSLEETKSSKSSSGGNKSSGKAAAAAALSDDDNATDKQPGKKKSKLQKKPSIFQLPPHVQILFQTHKKSLPNKPSANGDLFETMIVALLHFQRAAVELNCKSFAPGAETFSIWCAMDDKVSKLVGKADPPPTGPNKSYGASLQHFTRQWSKFMSRPQARYIDLSDSDKDSIRLAFPFLTRSTTDVDASFRRVFLNAMKARSHSEKYILHLNDVKNSDRSHPSYADIEAGLGRPLITGDEDHETIADAVFAQYYDTPITSSFSHAYCFVHPLTETKDGRLAATTKLQTLNRNRVDKLKRVKAIRKLATSRSTLFDIGHWFQGNLLGNDYAVDHLLPLMNPKKFKKKKGTTKSLASVEDDELTTEMDESPDGGDESTHLGTMPKAVIAVIINSASESDLNYIATLINRKRKRSSKGSTPAASTSDEVSSRTTEETKTAVKRAKKSGDDDAKRKSSNGDDEAVDVDQSEDSDGVVKKKDKKKGAKASVKSAKASVKTSKGEKKKKSPSGSKQSPFEQGEIVSNMSSDEFKTRCPALAKWFHNAEERGDPLRLENNPVTEGSPYIVAPNKLIRPINAGQAVSVKGRNSYMFGPFTSVGKTKAETTQEMNMMIARHEHAVFRVKRDELKFEARDHNMDIVHRPELNVYFCGVDSNYLGGTNYMDAGSDFDGYFTQESTRKKAGKKKKGDDDETESDDITYTVVDWGKHHRSTLGDMKESVLIKYVIKDTTVIQTILFDLIIRAIAYDSPLESSLQSYILVNLKVLSDGTDNKAYDEERATQVFVVPRTTGYRKNIILRDSYKSLSEVPLMKLLLSSGPTNKVSEAINQQLFTEKGRGRDLCHMVDTLIAMVCKGNVSPSQKKMMIGIVGALKKLATKFEKPFEFKNDPSRAKVFEHTFETVQAKKSKKSAEDDDGGDESDVVESKNSTDSESRKEKTSSIKGSKKASASRETKKDPVPVSPKNGSKKASPKKESKRASPPSSPKRMSQNGSQKASRSPKKVSSKESSRAATPSESRRGSKKASSPKSGGSKKSSKKSSRDTADDDDIGVAPIRASHVTGTDKKSSSRREHDDQDAGIMSENDD